MQKSKKSGLKKYATGVIFLGSPDGNDSFRVWEGRKTTFDRNNLSKIFLQAPNQKTPVLNEKSDTAALRLEDETHPAYMLFSGAGVPLIGMFQGASFC